MCLGFNLFFKFFRFNFMIFLIVGKFKVLKVIILLILFKNFGLNLVFNLFVIFFFVFLERLGFLSIKWLFILDVIIIKVFLKFIIFFCLFVSLLLFKICNSILNILG